MPRGKVYIRSKVKRGVTGTAPMHEEACVSTRYVDVTTAQPRANLNRRAFSPMHMEAGLLYHAPDGHDYGCYEHYWQSLKFFPGRPHAADKTWWRNRTVPKRRLTGVNPATCLYAADETRFPGEIFDYVESRKKFYVPDYTAKLNGSALAREAFQQIENRLAAGNDVVVQDYDGPRDANPGQSYGAPLIEEVTVDLLRDKINDATFPFGHGYVVAAKILGIPAWEYTV